MPRKNSSRGKDPSESTIRILCGKAAGMCQFEGCDKRLFYDNTSLSEFNNAYVAHVIASSPDGPRGDPVKSYELSDKIENLMLMCADHHLLIDKPDSGPREYPKERLQEMKRAHEEKMGKLCELFNKPSTELVMLSSPIKGKTKVNINTHQAAKAVIPERKPITSYGTLIDIASSHEYISHEYWSDLLEQLKLGYMSISNLLKRVPDTHISVFPIAPIPLIAKLGELVGDKTAADIYQKTRIPDTWEWQSKELTNKFIVEEMRVRKGKRIALILSLTDIVSVDRVLGVYPADIIISIRAETKGVDCIKSINDLSAFWHCYQETCDHITNDIGKESEIALFPAIPVSAAFELGRRFMHGVYPIIKIFDDCDGFFQTLNIGG